MNYDRDDKEKSIDSLEAMAKFILIIFIIIAVVLLIIPFRIAVSMPYSNITASLLLPIFGSLIMLVVGFLIYQYLIVYCNMARNSIDK